MNEKEDDPSLCGCCAGADSPAGHAASSSGSGSSGCLSDACCHCIADHSANPGCHADPVSFADAHTCSYTESHTVSNAETDSNAGEYADLGVHSDTRADAHPYACADAAPDSNTHADANANANTDANTDTDTGPGAHTLWIRTQNAGIGDSCRRRCICFGCSAEYDAERFSRRKQRGYHQCRRIYRPAGNLNDFFRNQNFSIAIRFKLCYYIWAVGNGSPSIRV